MKKILALLLALGLALCLSACFAQAIAAENLMEGIIAVPVDYDEDMTSGSIAATDFAVRLFQAALPERENTLISPVSVLYALAMTANGASGQTLAQMEQVLGMEVGKLNGFLGAYLAELPQEDKLRVHIANSLWFRDSGFVPNQDFLQVNADHYGADLYRAPFDDTTLRDINNWVRRNTDGMIPEILNEISPDAMMYLVNAMAFDAEWSNIYQQDSIRGGTFTTEDGTVRNVSMMFSDEHFYLQDDRATGFLKPYAGGRYAFMALLPNEGISMEVYLQALTGAHLHELIANPQSVQVEAGLPKFETEYSGDLSNILTGMGMTDAFDGVAADFSGAGTADSGNLYIDRVVHRTFICVDERGTRAGAATAVDFRGTSMGRSEKTVILDRPFIYMVVDFQTGLPLFIGTMMEPG